ncbi:protein kinase [Sorangium cellulosum]|uniref:Protein kinase n=1 Tax=Sorangium cellulosum TaxID=56 RepID=A0A2L0ET47_SORCE|nr:AAA family ATPase [Sorangium cellulosum]AUX42498.1 protein kinase [Sorangium cellulosum]
MTRRPVGEQGTTQIHGYHLTAKTGETAASVTYRARREGDGCEVAVRMLHADRTRIADITRFKHACSAMKRIDSERIVKVHGVEEHADGLLLITEYFPATALSDILKDRGELDVGRFLSGAILMAEALAHIHRRGLIHGDIRPRNILLGEGGKIKLTGFGVESIVTREREAIYSHEVLSEVLPYTSPEQTGRMNRSVDYRTDLYSLGVVFYEILIGRRPFEAADPLELIHAHIAVRPTPPSELSPKVPRALSAITMKLLGKNAEDRYQSAEGLRDDLEECRRRWEESGTIGNFTPGQHDRTDLFQIHQKLYGREGDIRRLIESFDDVLRGRRAIVLVSGYSGIGKSSLVQEILKPLARERGYYISGKYDQYNRDTPYSAVVHAFDALVKQLLSESEERVQRWRKALLDALGDNGQVICDVLPSLKHLIGEQPAVPTLGPVEAQNRLNFYFKKFVSVFARPAHPLAVFIDDLQWVDSASLSLLKSLLAGEEMESLFFCGAYRDNEVSPTHPFLVALEELQQARLGVVNIVLEPLRLAHLNELLSDSLRNFDNDALARAVLKKTGGNPFFVKQFLKHLVEAGVLVLDPAAGWRWDLSTIEELEYTDNVLSLMVQTIRRLPEGTQEVLRLAAAIGNSFELEVLNTVSASPPDATYDSLARAIDEGLVVGAGEGYRFAHDKIQEAAYALIPARDRPGFHYRIGKLLLGKLGADERQSVFDIVNHLNSAGDLIQTPEERLTSARLNLRAAARAEESTAFSASLKYLEHGISMLPADAWTSEYELAFAYHTKKGVLESLCERHDDAFATLSGCLDKARGRVHQTEVRRLTINVQILKNDLPAALDEGLAALRAFGIDLPPYPDNGALTAEIERTMAMIGDRPIASLIDLPALTDPEIAALQDLLQEMFSPTYQLGTNNFGITVMKMLQNSLTYGISRNSIYAYVNFGTLLCARLDIEKGYEFGRAAVRLNELKPDKKSEAMLCNMWGAWVQHWKESYATYKTSLRRGMHVGLETGEYIWAFYNACNSQLNSLLQGKDLHELVEEAKESEHICKLDRFNAITWIVGAAADLGEELSTPAGGDGGTPRARRVDLEAVAAEARRIGNTASLYFTNIFTVIGGVFKGAYEQVAEIWGETDPGADVMLGAWHASPCYYFYGGVAFSRASLAAAPERRVAYVGRLREFAGKLDLWAGINPQMFRHRSLILQAELARIEQRESAGALYDQAITAAREARLLHDEALANELCARHYLEKGREFLAHAYVAEAHRLYARWGATRVMERLERDFPRALQREAPRQPGWDDHRRAARSASLDPAAEADHGEVELDTLAVIKASQAISSEILFPALLERLMQSILESAGARKGLVILRDNDRLVVHAEGHVEAQEIKVFSPVPLDSCPDVAASVVQYVARTADSVVLGDAASDDQFAGDPYIARTQARAILAAPILRQGRLVGVIYLENDLTAGAFTPDRLEVTRLLAAQVAISMENALLYASLEEKVEARTVELEVAHRRIEIELSEKLALIARQKELIRALSTPILEVWDGVLTIPVVGGLDDDRAATIMQDLLERVVHTQSRATIIDLTGVGTIDPDTAERLVRIIRSVQLLGSQSVITGIQPDVARTMISHGLDLSRVTTRAKLRDGLRVCMGAGTNITGGGSSR